MKKLLVTVLTVCIMLCTMSINVNAKTLDEEQEDIIERITEICTENWEEYGILPSVCIAQAYMESHLGKYCYPNNLWGLYGGYTSFDSLDEGIYEYLEILNTYDSYSNALYRTKYADQINAIYDGGYCTTSREHYVNSIIWIIEEYDLTRYDAEILQNCYMKTSENTKTWKYIE